MINFKLVTGVTYDISKKKKKKNPILTGGASGGAKPLTGGAFAPPCPPLVPPLFHLVNAVIGICFTLNFER